MITDYSYKLATSALLKCFLEFWQLNALILFQLRRMLYPRNGATAIAGRARISLNSLLEKLQQFIYTAKLYNLMYLHACMAIQHENNYMLYAWGACRVGKCCLYATYTYNKGNRNHTKLVREYIATCNQGGKEPRDFPSVRYASPVAKR